MDNKTIHKFSLLFFILISTVSYSQVVFETDNSGIYSFLDRLYQKQIIQLTSEIKPYSKIYIVSKLKEIAGRKEILNKLEQQELDWYLRRYSLELDTNGHILGELNYIEDEFKTRIFPIAGYGISSSGGKRGHHRKIGAHFDAYYSDNFGVMFEYLDNGEFGDNVDAVRQLTPSTGHNFKGAPDGIEFSDVRAQVNFNWKWGSFSLKKDYNQWGHGKFGQLILSNKPASYPHIELRLRPTKWLRFYYIHGWLNSLVPDSANFYYSGPSKIQPILRTGFKSKYIAANMLSIDLPQKITFSLGNSFIYSGDLRPEMFIPFMYYKVMDHNTGREGHDDGNGMIFFDASVNKLKNYSFYGTLLIDVLEIRQILKGNWWTSWFGYTLGASKMDFIVDNLDLSIEYTKINPWVYENKFNVTNYKHLGYTLGHWIGQNSDLLSTQLDYSFLRGLHFSLSGQIFRKGGLKDIFYAYEGRTKLPFLYNPKRIDYSLRLKVFYEALQNLYISGAYSYSDISDDDPGRTPNYLLGKTHSFNLSLSYGLP